MCVGVCVFGACALFDLILFELFFGGREGRIWGLGPIRKCLHCGPEPAPHPSALSPRARPRPRLTCMAPAPSTSWQLRLL